MIHLPNGTLNPNYFRTQQEKMNKLKDALSTIEKLFKRLRVIYIEYQKHAAELDDVTSLVPVMLQKDGYALL